MAATQQKRSVSFEKPDLTVPALLSPILLGGEILIFSNCPDLASVIGAERNLIGGFPPGSVVEPLKMVTKN
jgi:hypothetical protein